MQVTTEVPVLAHPLDDHEVHLGHHHHHEHHDLGVHVHHTRQQAAGDKDEDSQAHAAAAAAAAAVANVVAIELAGGGDGDEEEDVDGQSGGKAGKESPASPSASSPLLSRLLAAGGRASPLRLRAPGDDGEPHRRDVPRFESQPNSYRRRKMAELEEWLRQQEVEDRVGILAYYLEHSRVGARMLLELLERLDPVSHMLDGLANMLRSCSSEEKPRILSLLTRFSRTQASGLLKQRGVSVSKHAFSRARQHVETHGVGIGVVPTAQTKRAVSDEEARLVDQLCFKHSEEIDGSTAQLTADQIVGLNTDLHSPVPVSSSAVAAASSSSSALAADSAEQFVVTRRRLTCTGTALHLAYVKHLKENHPKLRTMRYSRFMATINRLVYDTRYTSSRRSSGSSSQANGRSTKGARRKRGKAAATAEEDGDFLDADNRDLLMDMDVSDAKQVVEAARAAAVAASLINQS